MKMIKRRVLLLMLIILLYTTYGTMDKLSRKLHQVKITYPWSIFLATNMKQGGNTAVSYWARFISWNPLCLRLYAGIVPLLMGIARLRQQILSNNRAILCRRRLDRRGVNRPWLAWWEASARILTSCKPISVMYQRHLVYPRISQLEMIWDTDRWNTLLAMKQDMQSWRI